MAFIFLFVDGVGLGQESPSNPLMPNGSESSYLSLVSNGEPLIKSSNPVFEEAHLFKPIDACLGVEGLPQSGTGQATLFSGVNASKKLGRHFGPYPHSKIKPLLNGESLFGRLKSMGKSPFFMNAFPEVFFEMAHKRNRWSCCTLMTRNAGQKLNSIDEVLEGNAITADIRQSGWRDHLNLDVPEIPIQEAAERVIRMAGIHDLVLVEFYLTDKAGHSQDKAYAGKILTLLDRFIKEITKNKPKEISLLMTSDHGNIEDLSTKTHTRNDVPLFVTGPAAPSFRDVYSIMDVTPAILEMFKNA